MTNASPAEQARLLDLAEVDTELRQAAHQRRSLPEHDEVAALATAAAALQSARGEVAVRVADLERAVRKAEADVELVRIRAAKDNERLNAGGSTRDLQGLQHEIETLARRQSDLEDAELEVMEQLEGAQAEASELDAQAEENRAAAAQATTRRDAALAGIDARVAELTGRRDLLVSSVEPALLALYDRVASRSGGVAAAKLVGTRCGACRVEFPAVDLADIRRAAPTQVVQCQECDAILVRAQD